PSSSLTVIDGFIGMWLFFYYEVVIGVSIIITSMVFFFTRLITFVLPPMLGYILDRNYTSTRQLGKRFFWLIIPSILVPVFCVFLFIPSTSDPGLGLFFFLVFLGYNILYLYYKINYSAHLLNKFRHPKERLIVSTITSATDTIGYLFVALVTPMLISYGDPSSYIGTAIVVSIFLTITLLLGIPGFLEEEELLDTYFSSNLQPQTSFFRDFFKRFGYAFRQKNFILLLIRWLATAVLNLFFVSGTVYYTQLFYSSNPMMLTSFLLTYNIMIFIAIPIGFLISWFVGYLRVLNYSGLTLGISILLFTFIGAFPSVSYVLFAIAGFSTGLGTVSLIPIAGDTFDESTSINRKRSEGFLYGLLTLFSSVMSFVYAFVAALVHTSTGYTGDPYTPPSGTASFGIMILFSLIPGIVIISLQIVFMVLYDLKPDKVVSIQQKNKELQI
ncbi:MAG: MFS transporter, partial [Candidatus Hermodarchaeota archaeon]